MLRTGFWLVILTLGALALRGAGSGAWAAPPSDPPAAIRFTEVSHEAGIDFIHAFGGAHFSNLVEAVGSGAAWLDYD